jgi:hypothetical protein
MISSHLPDLINSYITVRAERLAKAKEVELLETQEKDLTKVIIAKYREDKIVIQGGALGNVKMHVKPKPRVLTPEAWDQYYAYIYETKRFELLHKRVTESVVEELWENGVEVPGVTKEDVYTLSVSGAGK